MMVSIPCRTQASRDQKTRSIQTMKIVDVRVRVFAHSSREVKDSDGHTYPGDPHRATQALLTIVADNGSEGIASPRPSWCGPF
jgi:hypothetical protein